MNNRPHHEEKNDGNSERVKHQEECTRCKKLTGLGWLIRGETYCEDCHITIVYDEPRGDSVQNG